MPPSSGILLPVLPLAESLSSLRETRGEYTLSGLSRPAAALLLAEISRATECPLLLVTPTPAAAETFTRDLRFFLGTEVSLFPEAEADPEAVSARLLTLSHLDTGTAHAVVAPVAALLPRLPSPERFRASLLSLYPQRIVSLDTLLAILERGGYRRVSAVREGGEYSPRGGLVDAFPPGRDRPVRVEFFGDEVVSLREFDPDTQRSVQPLPRVTLIPVSSPSLASSDAASLVEYLSSSTLIVLVSPGSLEAASREFRREVRVDQGRYHAWPHLAQAFARFPRLLLDDLPGTEGEGRLHILSLPAYRGKIPALVADLARWQREQTRVHLVCRSSAQGRRVEEILREQGVGARLVEESAPGHLAAPGTVEIRVGDLSAGFAIRETGLLFLTDSEIFGPRLPASRRARPKAALPFTSFEDLQYGDSVVHVDHGIARYKGLRQLPVGGIEGDYLFLEYAGRDKLYVPVDKLGLVQRYIGADASGGGPSLDRLGGTSWAKAKERVRASVREMAKELLDLYAARAVTPGRAMAPDTVWQKEFEAAFPYEETPDQLQAALDVKRDMERPRPMDRLVCGDVGYGKTEVAMRAAFKAVMSGAQVAVLVPTTVLALQHFQTFSERFGSFPVTVEMLSRFRPRVEQKEILRRVREGTVDILIGTHRLLQRDVRFRDLGLLVIDEEHRFGVAAKEKLKQIRREVDVLTLTATPIPRTLHMAMLGVRDVSTIDTPPEDRLSIATVLARDDPPLIQEVIERELGRGGQVFFVHNRVETITTRARLLTRLVPEARVALAHGQMREERLEKMMYDFYAKRYDILLCTAIIESGLDVPSANTILIDRADTFGLAQLYQLRGRVGRDKRQAYAYLLIPTEEGVGEVARKRLQVIAELTDLGSGFKVAARDLEIRGAGNLLGPEQHGYIAAVGFDLYCQLVTEAIREMTGEVLPSRVEPTIRLRPEGFIPEAYLPDPAERLTMYKRLLTAETEEALAEFAQEFADRFGSPPEPVRRLLAVLEVKGLARTLGVGEVDARTPLVRVVFTAETPVRAEKVVAVAEEDPRLRLLRGDTVEVQTGEASWAERLRAVKNLLQRVS